MTVRSACVSTATLMISSQALPVSTRSLTSQKSRALPSGLDQLLFRLGDQRFAERRELGEPAIQLGDALTDGLRHHVQERHSGHALRGH